MINFSNHRFKTKFSFVNQVVPSIFFNQFLNGCLFTRAFFAIAGGLTANDGCGSRGRVRRGVRQCRAGLSASLPAGQYLQHKAANVLSIHQLLPDAGAQRRHMAEGDIWRCLAATAKQFQREQSFFAQILPGIFRNASLKTGSIEVVTKRLKGK